MRFTIRDATAIRAQKATAPKVKKRLNGFFIRFSKS
jgi:hypothetical protein